MSDDLTSPRELARHSSFLRRLALALVGEEHADDLVQDTLLIGLQKAPPDKRWIGSWLRRVCVNLFRQRLRGESSRLKRELEWARREASPSTEESVEHRAAVTALARAVSNLKEPYYTAIRLRYFDGLMPQEISNRLDEPVGTVKRRLERARERLRADLAKGDVRWEAMLLPLAGLSATDGIGNFVPAGTTASAGSSSATILSLGGALMVKKSYVVAGVLLVGVLAAASFLIEWNFADRNNEREEQRVVGTSQSPVDSSGSPALPKSTGQNPIRTIPLRREGGTEDDSQEKREQAKDSTARAALKVRILTSDGKPVVGRRFEGFVSYHDKGGDSAKLLKQEEQGVAVFWGIFRGLSTHGGHERSEKTCDDSGYLKFSVAAGRPGRLRLIEIVGDSSRGRRFIPRKVHWLAVLPYRAVSPEETQILPDVRLPPLPPLVSGWVQDERGRPVPRATVYALPKGRSPSLTAERKSTLVATTDKEGRFRIETDMHEVPRLLWAHKGLERASALAGFEPGQDGAIITIRPTGSIKGRIRIAEKLKSVSTFFSLRPEGVPDAFNPQVRDCSPVNYLKPKRSGEFSHSGIPAGTYRLTVKVGLARILVLEGIQILPAALNEDPRLQDLVVGQDMEMGTVRVVDETGAPIAKAQVYISPLKPDARIRGSYTSSTDEEGCVAYPLPAGTLVRVRAQKRGYLDGEYSKGTLPATVVLRRGTNVSISVSLTGTLEVTEDVVDFWFVLVPKEEALKAEQAERTPIPKRIHNSRVFRFRRGEDCYSLKGVEPLAYAAFVVPIGKNVRRGIGHHWTAGEVTGLRVGSVDLSGRHPDSSPTIRIDAEAVRRFAEK